MAKLDISFPDGNSLSFDLPDDTTTIGRVADNSLQIEHVSVSSRHAELARDSEDSWKLVDLGSTNGTFVNGQRVTECMLVGEESIRFGVVDCVFRTDSSAIEQPLPQSVTASGEAAASSQRPADFVSSSPIPKNVVVKDPLAAVFLAYGVLAIIGFCVVAAMTLTLQLPS